MGMSEAGMPAGISTGLCILILLVSRSLLHGPMMLLANFVALPVNVSAPASALTGSPVRARWSAWPRHHCFGVGKCILSRRQGCRNALTGNAVMACLP